MSGPGFREHQQNHLASGSAIGPAQFLTGIDFVIAGMRAET
jgi:hypothetical protein